MSDAPPADPYDAVPFESRPSPATHPDALAVAAWRAGLDPAPTGACRVLEIGCGDGANLLPIAFHNRQSAFIGVERARSRVLTARAAAAALGLENVRFVEADVAALPDLGEQDYVIAQGVFSWVPPATREALLAYVARSLAPEGVFSVSYNARPAWAIRGELRRVLLLAAPAELTAAERIARARAALAALVEHAAEPSPPPSALLLVEDARRMMAASDALLLHDVLAEHNEPFDLAGFLALTEPHGLRFVADLATFADGPGRAFLAKQLGARGMGAPVIEAMTDLLRWRSARQTVLARTTRERRSALEAIAPLHLAAALRVASAAPSLEAGVPERFHADPGATITESRAVGKAMLLELAEAFPETRSFAALVERARARLADERAVATDALAQDLLALHDAGLCAALRAPHTLPALEARPRVSALTTHEAERHPWVTGAGHVPFELDAFDRHLVRLLDGRRDPAAIVAALYETVRAGRLVIHDPKGARLEGARAIAEALPSIIQTKLASYAVAGLIV